MSAIADFLRFALPLVPDLLKVVRAFFQAFPQHGPPPPDMAAWAKGDAEVDEMIAKRRAADRLAGR